MEFKAFLAQRIEHLFSADVGNTVVAHFLQKKQNAIQFPAAIARPPPKEEGGKGNKSTYEILSLVMYTLVTKGLITRGKSNQAKLVHPRWIPPSPTGLRPPSPLLRCGDRRQLLQLETDVVLAVTIGLSQIEASVLSFPQLHGVGERQ